MESQTKNAFNVKSSFAKEEVDSEFQSVGIKDIRIQNSGGVLCLSVYLALSPARAWYRVATNALWE